MSNFENSKSGYWHNNTGYKRPLTENNTNGTYPGISNNNTWQARELDRSYSDDVIPPMVPPKDRSTSSLSYNMERQNPTTASVLDNSTYDSYCLDNLDYNKQTTLYQNSSGLYSGYRGTEMGSDSSQKNEAHIMQVHEYGASQYGQQNYERQDYGSNNYGNSQNSLQGTTGYGQAPPLVDSGANGTRAPPLGAPSVKQRFKVLSDRPWVVYILSVVQLCVFVAELIKMGVLTGSPIQTQPTFNPMIGPSSYVLINMGARFTPCMHAIPGITNLTNVVFPCPNSTTISTNVCSLSELCGMGGIPNPGNTEGLEPNQWWRFIVPIFLHAGIIHISFNMLLQIKLGSELEKGIGHIRFFIIYFAAGIGGFIFGGNFTPDGIASTGASGSLFGIIALDLLDLLFNWQLYQHPKRALLMHGVEIVISFAIGLLPGLDNFSHIGGFVIGLLLGTALLRSPLPIRRRVDPYSGGRVPPTDRSPSPDLFPDFSPEGTRNRYTTAGAIQNSRSENKSKAVKIDWLNPKRQFENRAPLWYAWLVVRLAAIALAITYYVVLIKHFENGGGHCGWCKYLSCLPVKGWCDIGNITTTSSNSSMTVLFLFLLTSHSKGFKRSMGLF